MNIPEDKTSKTLAELGITAPEQVDAVFLRDSKAL